MRNEEMTEEEGIKWCCTFFMEEDRDKVRSALNVLGEKRNLNVIYNITAIAKNDPSLDAEGIAAAYKFLANF